MTVTENTRSILAAAGPSAAAPRVRRASWWVGVGAGAFVALLALAAPLLVRFDPTRVAGRASQPPGPEFWFGTDANGLDVFSRTMTAAQLDIGIATLATVMTTVIGIALGVLIGSNESAPGLRGAISRGAVRAIDLFQAIPALLLGIVIIALFGAGFLSILLTTVVILVRCGRPAGPG